MNQVEFTYAGEVLTLLADKALFWQRTKTLVIADPHFGKAAAFRHAGIAVPEEVTNTDLSRLDKLLGTTSSRRLLILGDFFHARSGRTDVMMQAVGSWCERRGDLEVVLIPGNHDKHSGAPPSCWKFEVVDEMVEGPFVFRHEPTPRRKAHTLCGHLHPCIALGDKVGSGFRAPCFWFADTTAVLPAFGSFTGTRPVEARRKEAVFAVKDGEIFRIPDVLLRAK